MTHHPIKVLEDGTRVYVGGRRYKPVPPEQRKTRALKPPDPRAVRYHAQWFLPLELLPDNRRSFPLTRPDDEAYEHAQRTMMCGCEVCIRPTAQRWRDRWLREQARSRRTL